MHNLFNPKLNILHIDDSTVTLSSVKHLIAKFTAHYYQATTAKLGIKLYHEQFNTLDLVIVDINLPDTNGLSIVKHIREQNPTVVLVILTAEITQTTIENFQNVLIDLFITKDKIMADPYATLRAVASRVKIHRMLTKSNNAHLNFQYIDKLTIQARLDLLGNYTHVNTNFCAITGYSCAELIGQNSRIMKHPDRDPKIIKELWQTLQEGKEFHGTFPDRTRRGETIYLQKNIIPMRDQNGRIFEHFLLAFDVTDSQKLKEVMACRYTALETVIATLPNIVCITDGFNLVAVNKNFCRYFHVDTLKTFKKSHDCICELFLDDEKELIVNTPEKNWISAILDKQEMGYSSKVKLHRNGLENYFRVSIEATENGLCKVIFVDITNNEVYIKHHKDAIVSKKIVGENAGVVILLLDSDANVLDASATLEEQTGYASIDLMGNSSMCLCAADNSEASCPTFIQEASQNGYAQQEQWLRKKGGELYYSEISLTKIKGNHLHDDYFVFVSRDLTAQLNSIENLRDIHDRYHAMLERTSDGYVIINGDGLLLESNHRYQAMIGYSKIELLQMNIQDLAFMNQSMSFKEAHPLSLLDKGWKQCEWVQKTSSGTSIVFGVTITLIKEDLYVISLTDLSEFKRQEQMLAYSARAVALGETVGNIAHQWRQPLATVSAIMTELEFYQELGELTDEIQSNAFERIGTSIAYLSNTIDDFRSFFRGDTSVSMVALSDTITFAITVVEHSFQQAKIAIVIDDESHGAKVAINAHEFSQVLINLLNNARDVLTDRAIKDPTVTIVLGFNETYHFVKVHDNAGGIEPAIITKIFDPYFTTKHQSQGTGLGLHMASALIEKHLHGFLSVSNVGEGAEFLIRLPRKVEVKASTNQ